MNEGRTGGQVILRSLSGPKIKILSNIFMKSKEVSPSVIRWHREFEYVYQV